MNCYQRIVDMAKIAQKSGVIKGMLVHQGESNPDDDQWCGRLKKIHDDLCADLGLNPNTDGSVIRLNLPQLTEERRKELVKTANKRTEEARVSIRNMRRDIIEGIKKAEKAKEITEDDSKDGQDKAQKLTDKMMKEIDKVIEAKEKEIMEV